MKNHDKSEEHAEESQALKQAKRAQFERLIGSVSERIDSENKIGSQEIERGGANKAENTQPRFYQFWKYDTIAAFTLGLLVVGILQWCTYRDQLAMSRLDQRAWVGVKFIRLFPMKAGETLKAEMEVIDTGKTFALHIYAPATFARCFGGPITASGEADMASDLKKMKRVSSNGVLFPNVAAVVPCESDAPIDENTARGVASGEILLYVMAKITYDDIFGVGHYTEIFGVYRPKEQRFEMQPTHNDAN